MSSGSWSKPWAAVDGSISCVHTRYWDGADRTPVSYPKASIVSVDRASELWKDLENEKEAWQRVTAQSIRREARRQGVAQGLIASGNGFFHYGRSGGEKPPRRVFTKDNPYYVVEQRKLSARAVFRRGNNEGLYEGAQETEMEPYWLTFPPTFANDQIALVNKLREKMQGSSFNAGVLLAESNEALRLVADTAIRVAKSIHHITRGDLAGSARAIFEGTSRAPIRPYSQMRPFKPTVDRSSSLWLEMRYGWQPLLSEASDAATFVSHQLHAPARRKYKASLRHEYRKTRTTPAWPVGPWADPVTGQSRQIVTRWLTAVIAEKPHSLGLMDHLDPAVIAWERLPLSFVADWFIPIGGWLQARAAVNSLQCEYHVRATKEECEAFAPVSPSIVSRSATANFHSVVFQREVIQGAIKVPMPTFTPLAEALTVRRCVDSISLVAQAFLGGISKWSRPMG